MACEGVIVGRAKSRHRGGKKGTEMKASFVCLSVELNVECPNPECSEYFDLFKNQELTEEGLLYRLVFPNNRSWGCSDFEKELDGMGIEIHCPKCKTKIEIESVEW